MVGFSSASLFPAKKREAVIRAEPRDRPPDAEENPGMGEQARPWSSFRYIYVKQEHERGPSDPPTIDSPHPHLPNTSQVGLVP